MNSISIKMVILLLLPATSYGADAQWTWLYKKIFSPDEFEQHQKPAVTLCKEDIPLFNQLMVSWNARRPNNGFFSFWVQTRDAKTKEWHAWHKMMEWGNGVQRSFNSEQGLTKYMHVRLEMGNKPADAFRIKAIAHNGAGLEQFKALFVAVSDFEKFKAEKASHTAKKLASVVVDNVPKKSQMTLPHERCMHMCSPTSCSMLISYLLGKDIEVVPFAERSFDAGLNAYGSWPFNMAHAFECCGGDILFAAARLPSFYHLYQRLEKGIPVVVSVRGFLPGAPKVYEHGHLLMVIGFNAQKQMVICHDPAFKRDDGIVQTYPLKSFLAAWERSSRLAYLAHPLAIPYT